MTEEEYRRHLSAVLTNAYPPGAEVSLCDAVRLSFGAFPSDVLAALREIGVTVRLLDTELCAPVKSRAALPAPHPADFDWRFMPASCDWLTAQVSSRLSVSSGQVLLLGAPSLVESFTQRGVEVVLIDRNPLVTSALSQRFGARIVTADFLSRICLPRSYDVVVADPPWYPEHYLACFERAAELCTDYGFVFLSVLPWLTRPSALEDRRDILKFAQREGFELWEVLPASLKYESPLFEQEALLQHGIKCCSWRAADLFIFRNLRLREATKHPQTTQRKTEDWTGYLLPNGLHVKIRPNRFLESRPFTFEEISKGKTLDTVSRRYAKRERIDVWTSTNCAYSTSNREICETLISLISSGKPASEALLQVSLGFDLSSEEQRGLDQLALALEL